MSVRTRLVLGVFLAAVGIVLIGNGKDAETRHEEALAQYREQVAQLEPGADLSDPLVPDSGGPAPLAGVVLVMAGGAHAVIALVAVGVRAAEREREWLVATEGLPKAPLR